MSKRDPALLIADMLRAIDKLTAYTEGMDFDTFMADSRTVDAVERNFESIGEAAGQLPQAFKDGYPHIAWRGVVSFRNRLIHGCFGVDYQILWYILRRTD
jgi:uncharacterized protein with HEPN domain